MTHLVACQAGQSIDPQIAGQWVTDSWQRDQHTVWEIEWPAMPVAGPVTVETWRAGERYRYEILEAPSPMLGGETLIFDGERAWHYNRFDPEPPLETREPWLSPISDAFALITTLLENPPAEARQAADTLRSGPSQRLTFDFETGQQLIFWRDEATGLPVRLHILGPELSLSLDSRSVEPLIDPPPGLFKPTK
ncbi:MAG: hypothetical protein R3264_01870 [Anaerolineae bacterium]|nr:hypothetical protein [Anaerolineae bacterium]